jgi:hypothetical protein
MAMNRPSSFKVPRRVLRQAVQELQIGGTNTIYINAKRAAS